MKKDSVNVKLPMCDTLAFLRLSLVEGFHLAFVQRIWIICWKFCCMIMGIDELLRTSTWYNSFGVESVTWLKTRWIFFLFFDKRFVQLWCNSKSAFLLVRTILQHRETRRKRTDSSPCSFPAWHVALLWCDQLGSLLFSDPVRVEWCDWGRGSVLLTVRSSREWTGRR